MSITTTTTGTAASPRPGAPASRRHALRAVGVLGAVVVAVVVLEVLALAGSTVHVPRGDGVAPLSALLVAVAAVTAGLAGWALLAGLDRLVARPARVWRVAALVVLVLSFAGPWTAAGVATADRVGLSLLHLAVAGVLVASLPRTAHPRTR